MSTTKLIEGIILEILENKEKKLNFNEVAKEVGVSREWVRQVALKMNIKGDNSRKEYNCSECGIKGTREKFSSRKYCKICSVKKRKQHNLWSFKYKLNACRDCGRSKVRHVSNGWCYNCRYKNDPIVRTKQDKATRKWMKNHKEQNRKIQYKAIKKYYLTHREEILQKQKERYYKNHEKSKRLLRERRKRIKDSKV